MGFKVFPEKVEILSKDLNQISGMILKDIYDGVFALGICQKHGFGVFNDSFKITRRDFFEVTIRAGAGFHANVSSEEQPFPINLPMYMANDVTFPLNSAGTQPRYDLIMVRNVISEDPFEQRNYLDDAGDKQTGDLLVSKSFGVEFSIETGAESDNPIKPPVPNGWTPLAYVIVTPGIGVVDDSSVIDARYIFDDYISGQELRDVEQKVDQNTIDIAKNTQDIDYIKNNPPEIPSGGLEPRELVITKLESEDLKANSMYLVYPDKNEPANNILKLPRGIEGDVILIQDPEWDFQNYPVKITCTAKIDGYDSIILDVPHGWLEFTWSEINKTWKTRDSYGTVEKDPDDPNDNIEIPENIITEDNLEDNLRASPLLRDHERRIIAEEFKEQADQIVLQDHKERIEILEASEGSSQAVRDLQIDSALTSILKHNSTYLVLPDENTQSNNVLRLPAGQPSSTITIVDVNWRFKSHPVTIKSSEVDQKIDGFDELEMNLAHCWIDFVWSEAAGEWKTKDAAHIPLSNPDDQPPIIEGTARKIEEKIIDSLDPIPLSMNTLYLIKPDKNNADNNLLALPRAVESGTISILDYTNEFVKHPLIISSAQKIDGFDTITLDLQHCYIDFIFNEEKGTWVTNDYIFKK